MAKTPVLERPTSLKVLGIGFLALVVFFVWLTWAFFNKTFVSSVPVTLTTSQAGSQLPKNADVKLRGMIVGEVRSVVPDGEGVKMNLAMNPDLIKEVPAGVTAQILPKTLFGEKYVALIPPEGGASGSLKAGDVITKAEVPIEVETLLNDFHPLLEAVNPADLNYTLSAVSTALEGRGEQLGDTLVTLNDYLQEINPEVPTLVDDLVKFGQVADVYADAVPNLGRVLENSVITGRTIVTQQQQLSAFFNRTAALADTLTDFVDESGDDIVALNADGRPSLRMIGDYSATFPCFLAGLDRVIPRLNKAFGEGRDEQTLHIDLEIIGLTKMPTGYTTDEAFVLSQAALDAEPAARPSCLQLEEIVALTDSGAMESEFPYPQDKPYEFPVESIYTMFGLKTTHGKYCAPSSPDATTCGDRPLPRSAAAGGLPGFLDAAGIEGNDTASERRALNRLIGASLRMNESEVPDLASLLVGPIYRGAEVRIHEAAR